MKKVKCLVCDQVLNCREEGYLVEIGSHKGKLVCDDCWFDDLAEPIATVILAKDGERYTGKVGNYGFEAEDYCGIGSGSDFYRLVSEYADSVKWHASDAWRGYYEGKLDGLWTKVLDSWFGTIDAFFHEDDLLDRFHQRWEQGEETPPFDVFVAFPRTSNVCSCGIDVYVPKGKEEEFTKWVKSGLNTRWAVKEAAAYD